jgi:hypothetical protein
MRECEKYSGEIPLFVNGSLSEKERGLLLHHLALCSACQRELAGLIKIQDSVEESVRETADVSSERLNYLYEKVISALDTGTVTSKYRTLGQLIDKVSEQIPAISLVRLQVKIAQAIRSMLNLIHMILE